MSHSMMPLAPVELTDLELDAVSGGAPPFGTLVNVDVDVRDIDIIDDVTVRDINVAVAALGAAAGIFRPR